jgi:hypothetical protein
MNAATLGFQFVRFGVAVSFAAMTILAAGVPGSA